MSRAGSYFTPDLFSFFRALERHNNRDWFLANKTRIDDVRRKDFVAGRSFTERQVCPPQFMRDVADECRRLGPLIEFPAITYPDRPIIRSGNQITRSSIVHR